MSIRNREDLESNRTFQRRTLSLIGRRSGSSRSMSEESLLRWILPRSAEARSPMSSTSLQSTRFPAET